MPKKIRVYELGRELGLTNKEALDLCIQLGIGVKSHSSSIEEQQADRVRRKADQEGLRRPVQPGADAKDDGATTDGAQGAGAQGDGAQGDGAPAERAPAERAPAESAKPGGARKAAARTEPPSERPAAAAAAHAGDAPAARTAEAPAAARTGERPAARQSEAPAARAGEGVRSRQVPPTSQPQAPAAAATGTAPAAPAHAPVSRQPTPTRPAAQPAGTRAASPSAPPSAAPVRQPGMSPATPSVPAARQAGAPSSPSSRQAGSPGAGAAPRQPGAAGGGPTARQAGSPATSGPAAGARARAASPGQATPGQATPGQGADGSGAGQPGAPMLSSSGKPIPPPPGLRRPPTSASGKPIPPPPGRGPRAPSPGAGAGGGRPSGPGAGRPSGAGGGFRGAPRPSTGGAGGGGGGYRGGPPGGGGFRGGGPGGGGAPGAGAGAGTRGGAFGNRGRPGGRRPTRRRRRNIEELEAQELTHYTPSNAPVPVGEIIVERGSTAQELGPKLNRSGADVVRFLFQQGEMVTTTQSLSDDMIELFAAELGADIRLVDPGEEKEAELQAKYFDDEEEDDEALRLRPPVVTIMGHVDHGKTLLLDRIRETNVVAGEAGGITQHIGAYQVTYNGQLITFIDTPGHEAFTAMRARGAEVTDIVILVVAADDGVMPQTVEAINHAKAAEVPIIVALNKIDRPEADPNRVMQQLSEQGLVPEAWGGDTIMVEISALQNLGIDDLLEQVLLVSELEELSANPEGRARGIVLEANLDAGKGPVATVIVQSGTLRVSDSVVAGASWGRVKALLDDSGDNVKEAAPSTPVQILGFDNVPSAGDEFRVTDKAKTARDIAEQREQRFRAFDQRRTSSATGTGAKLEDIFEQIQRGETATLNLVLKADTQGSLEAVTESLRKLERDEVKLSFIHRAVGGITENDVSLAEASNATIIGFNVRPDRGARELAEVHDVEIRTYEIIYKLIEDIESAMVGMLAPEFEEVITGEAEVREIFRVPRVGAIAGCYVRHGVITRGSKVRFLRDGVIIWKGAITSLKRFKDDVREVHEGFECGIGLSNNQDLRQGDVIETFEEREIPRT